MYKSDNMVLTKDIYLPAINALMAEGATPILPAGLLVSLKMRSPV
jgi:hypothetical protein